MTKDEALDLALEALESCGAGHITDGGNQWHDEKLVDKAITAIKQARSAPVQEPVAYWIPKAEQFCIADPSGRPFAKAWQPLYTKPPAAPVQEPNQSPYPEYDRGFSNGWDRCFAAAQRQSARSAWVGLTDELLRKMHHEDEFGLFCDYDEFEQIARAIEAKLKEKNT